MINSFQSKRVKLLGGAQDLRQRCLLRLAAARIVEHMSQACCRYHDHAHEATALLLGTSPCDRSTFEGWGEFSTISECLHKDSKRRPGFLASGATGRICSYLNWMGLRQAAATYFVHLYRIFFGLWAPGPVGLGTGCQAWRA